MNIVSRSIAYFLSALVAGVLAACSSAPAPQTVSAEVIASPAPRERSLFVEDWRFALGDISQAAEAEFDDDDWREVDLPHDWGIEGEYREDNPSSFRGGYLPGGIGWYRKSFAVPAEWAGKAVSVVFDGVYMNATVYVNGVERAHRPYGYIGFEVDLTGHLVDGENVIAVRVDNERQPSGRWYTGSGIYRDVWLSVTEPVRVVENGSYIRTPVVTADRAEVVATHEVLNPTSSAINAVADLVLFGPSGNDVARVVSNVSLKAGDVTSLDHVLQVTAPRRWSPDSPDLYRAQLTLRDEDGNLLDEYATTIGLRSIEFTTDRGFVLNGVPLLIKGMCMHHDGGAVGAAVPLDVLRYRLQLLKDAGVNAIRTAHNPFAPEFYQLADEMGFLLMNEAFDGWETPKADADYGLYFEEWWERDLTDFIRRDRNHPSVVIWSVGNEVVDATPETQMKLIDTIKGLDDTRPVTQGRGYWLPYADIAGFNGHGEYVNALQEFHAENPTVPLIGTEITHTLHTRGVYRSTTEIRERDIRNPKFRGEAANRRWLAMKDKVYPVADFTEEEVWPSEDRLYASSFDNNIVRMPIREEIRLARELPYLLGTFRWTAFDYLGESRGWPARTTNFGVIDLADFPKGPYWLYKSQWSSEPMVHLDPHWTHPGKEGVTMPVVVYTNLETAELFVNGVSAGVQTMGDDMQLMWLVDYEPGEIKVVATGADGTVRTMAHRTADEPAAMSVNQSRQSMPADNRSVVRFEIDIVDNKGELAPHADSLVAVDVSGGGRLIGLENGDILDLSGSKGTTKKAFNGKLVALIQSDGGSDPITVSFRSAGMSDVTRTVGIVPQ